METLRTFLIFGALSAVFFVAPIAVLVLFVNARAKARRAMLQGPWTALAQQFGGRLEGERVLVSRDVYQMTLGMQLVSVMQAVGSPYYSDGGTYTEARLQLDPRSGMRLLADASARPARLDAGRLARALTDTAFGHLPPDTRVVLGEREAAVVFHGPVGDLRAIGAAFASLQSLAERVRVQGPVAVPA